MVFETSEPWLKCIFLTILSVNLNFFWISLNFAMDLENITNKSSVWVLVSNMKQRVSEAYPEPNQKSKT